MKEKSVYFWGQLVLTLSTAAFLLIPILQSVLAGLTRNYFEGISSGLTVRWLLEVWTLYHDTIFRTIWIGVSCLILNLLVGVPAAYVMVKHRGRLTRILEELLVVPLAVPGLAIALGILISFGGWTAFRQSWLIILAGHLIFTLPFMVRSVIAILSSFDLDVLEESAASLGAGFWSRFFHIVIPNAAFGILSGALMVFTLSIGEFNLTWMLHTPLMKTLPVGLADSYASMRLEIGAAYTLIFLLMIVPLLMAMQWIAADGKRIEAMLRYGTKMMNFPFQKISRCARAPELHPESSVVEREGTAITLTGCAKTFATGSKALRPVDLEVSAGETLVILGPSGCGKTTLLRIIAGLETPDDNGRVFFNGEDVTRVPIEQRNVGMVFQSYALFPNMTVAENIRYGLKIRGDSLVQQEQRLDEMLQMMKIGALKDRRIDQLSGGQRQRVALARAIAVRPRILLLDEPLTALDAKLRDVLRVEIDQLLRSIGITTVYVTHDQAEAMALGDRIVVMDEGRISQIGTPREIYYSPDNKFVAEFVGTLNQFPAREDNGQIKFMDTCLPHSRMPHVSVKDSRDLELFFRPEHARVSQGEQGHFKGRIHNSIFVGDRTQLIVGANDGPNQLLFHVQAAGQSLYKPGEIVDVHLELSEVFTVGRSEV
ncbi:MAG: ATP-binding cassette domain-containing protein [Desulfuromonadales bacterium]|nr:ATP-binding cassette domain-containing protein [Desulfuromonadales bacterium]